MLAGNEGKNWNKFDPRKNDWWRLQSMGSAPDFAGFTASLRIRMMLACYTKVKTQPFSFCKKYHLPWWKKESIKICRRKSVGYRGRARLTDPKWYTPMTNAATQHLRKNSYAYQQVKQMNNWDSKSKWKQCPQVQQKISIKGRSEMIYYWNCVRHRKKGQVSRIFTTSCGDCQRNLSTFLRNQNRILGLKAIGKSSSITQSWKMTSILQENLGRCRVAQSLLYQIRWKKGRISC